jgi:Phosphotransferase enzyme family
VTVTATGRTRRDQALAATLEVASAVGLDATGARVMKDSNNTIVLLPAERLVSKVSTSTLGGRGRDALERELRLGHHLAEHGAAIAPPARTEVAGPHECRGVVLTLWRYCESRPEPSDGGVQLGEALRGFHTALADMARVLPPLEQRVDRAAELLQAASATPHLSDADRRLAARAHPRLRELFDGLDSATALHGEPHAGNVIWTEAGPVLIDFEASCVGPLEWDLAYVPEPALAAFPGRDDAAVAKLRAAVSFCVAAWCWAQPTRAPEVAAAATHHLDVLRRSWLAA